MNHAFRFAAAMLLVGTLAACAETPPAPPAAAGTVASAQPVEKTCQTDDDTGSHLRKKTVCATIGDDAQDRTSMDNAMRAQRANGMQSTGH